MYYEVTMCTCIIHVGVSYLSIWLNSKFKSWQVRYLSVWWRTIGFTKGQVLWCSSSSLQPTEDSKIKIKDMENGVWTYCNTTYAFCWTDHPNKTISTQQLNIRILTGQQKSFHQISQLRKAHCREIQLGDAISEEVWNKHWGSSPNIIAKYMIESWASNLIL